MENKIDITTVNEIAHLARLEFNEEAKSEILNDINRMLSFIGKLNELDTDNIEPLILLRNCKVTWFLLYCAYFFLFRAH